MTLFIYQKEMHDMYDFFMPNVNFFGRGSVDIVGERCAILGAKKALIVTDTFLRGLEGGPVDKVIESIMKEGIEFTFYDKVEPKPKDTKVRYRLDSYERVHFA